MCMTVAAVAYFKWYEFKDANFSSEFYHENSKLSAR